MFTASVIPLVRMPRRFGVFSYIIPDDLVGNVEIGHLVIIPFRSKEIFGVVVQVQTSADSEQSLKSIRRKIGDKPLFGANHVEIMRIFSDWYGISLSNAALLFTPPLQKRKLLTITRDSFDEIKPSEKKSKKINYHLYIDEVEHKKYLSRTISGNTLILAPSKEVQKQIFNLLPPEEQKKTVLWDSTLGPKKKFEAWWDVRKGIKSIILGTKSAVFFPFTELESIIVDHEESEYHKNWDQSPRFQTKDIAQLLANFYSSELHYFSFSPSIESYAQIFADTYNLPDREEKITKQQRLFIKNSDKQKPVIVDMRDERKARNYTLFSDAVVDAILNTHGDLFIHINRLGSATSVGCQDCGFTSTCPTCNLPLVYHEIERVLVCPYGHTKQSMILICPKCNSSLVRLRILH
jgi:primosomal protein N'